METRRTSCRSMSMEQSIIVSLLFPLPRLPSLASTPKKAILKIPVYLFSSWTPSPGVFSTFSLTSGLTAMFSSLRFTFSAPVLLSVAFRVTYRIQSAAASTVNSNISNGICLIHFFLSI